MPDFDEVFFEVFGRRTQGNASSLERVKRVFYGDRHLSPRPFQLDATREIGNGSNVLLVAGTAQGKTEAVIVPLVATLLDGGREHAACYIAPTRALLNDLHGRLAWPLAQLGINAVIRHGDRRSDTNDPAVDLLLTTPESLDVLFVQQADILSKIRIVVLDEVHHLFGTPRGAHVVSLLERLKWRLAEDKSTSLQRVALSATVGDPQSVAKWLSGSDPPAVVIESPVGRRIDASMNWCATDDDTASWLTSLQHRKTLVFVNSRRHCEELASSLAELFPGEVLVHYSDLETSDRHYVEERMRRADNAVCVATGTLELGIDIGNIDAVFVADPPTSVQSFLQRVGRAARTQASVPVYLPVRSDVDLLSQIALLSLAQRGRIEDEPYPEWYSVLAQQVLSLVAASRRARIHEKVPWEVFGCWTWFDRDTAAEVLNGLAAAEFLEREEQIKSYRQARNLANMLAERGVSSNIGDSGSGVPVYYGKRRLGAIQDHTFADGDVFRYAGRCWRVISTSATGMDVVPSHAVQGTRFSRWTGGGFQGMSRLLAQEMRLALLGSSIQPASMSQQASERWQLLRSMASGLPEDSESVWEVTNGSQRTYYTFAGHLENDSLRLMLEQQGYSVRLAKGRHLGGIALVSTQGIAFSGSTEESIRRLQEDHWRQLRRWTQSGPFFQQLPTSLKRREVVSQLNRPEIIKRLREPRRIVTTSQVDLR